MDIIIVSLRTIVFYFIIMLVYRIMGKREFGQLSVMDLIVSFILAELAAISIENFKDNILLAIVPIFIITGLQVLLAYITLKLPKFRLLMDGKPSIIIKNGIVNFNEMTKQKYNLDELLLQLRDKQVKSIEDVEYAILENNGKLSVFKYNFLYSTSSYPMPLILDGIVQHDTLTSIKKNELWLKNLLDKKGIIKEDIFYAFQKGNKTFIIKKSDLK